MYAVSNDYKTAMLSPVQEHDLKGTIDNTAFDSEDVLAGSFSISNSAMDATDIKYGAVNIGELTMTVVGSLVTRGTWKGKVITPQIGLKIGNAYEYVPVGVYTVDKAQWSAAGVAIVAYDNMAKFDEPFPGTDVYQNLTAYTWLTTMCNACGVTLGSTQAQIEAMPHGTGPLGIHKENDIKTWRDVLSWLAQSLAGFATINRSGQLEIKHFGNDTGMTFDATKRFSGATLEDFVTHYTGVGLELIDQNAYHYVHATPDDGETMKLGPNPFLQHYLASVIDANLQSILDELANFEYTPFRASMLGDVAFDLGDVIEFTGGIAESGGNECCIMAFAYKFRQRYSCEGYGDNPALADAESKTDKSLGGVKSSVSQNTKSIEELQTASLAYLLPSETDTSEIGDGEENDVLTWYFRTEGNPSKVELVCTLEYAITLTDEQATVTIVYLKDDVVEDILERVYVHDGKYIITLSYLMDVSASAENTFVVRMRIDGGTLGDDVEEEHASDNTWSELRGYSWNYARTKLTDWGTVE